MERIAKFCSYKKRNNGKDRKVLLLKREATERTEEFYRVTGHKRLLLTCISHQKLLKVVLCAKSVSSSSKHMTLIYIPFVPQTYQTPLLGVLYTPQRRNQGLFLYSVAPLGTFLTIVSSTIQSVVIVSIISLLKFWGPLLNL